MATKLVETREALNAARKEWGDLWESKPDRDFTPDEVDTLRQLNAKMTDLGKQADEQVALERMADEAKGLDRYLHQPATTIPFPNGSTDGKAAEAPQPWAQQLVESAVVKLYDPAQKRSPSVEITAPDFWGAKTLLTEVGYAPQSVRTSRIVEGALRRPMVADLMPEGRTTQIAVVYMEETTTTNAAALTGEGTAKPESALAFTERSAPIRKVATVLPVTDELMADVPMLRDYLEARLRLFVALEEEDALLTGANDTAPNFTGFINKANVLTQAKGADPVPDAVRKGITQIQTNAFVDPSGAVFHPNDWRDVALLRTADGQYIWGHPSEGEPERIWGLPVVQTTAMPEGTALVGAFNTMAQVWRRSDLTFAVSDQNEDFFIKNKLMLRAEERLTLTIYRPAAFCLIQGI
jgi:HK97 family phage major capsid protein